eukprot:CAMPEP_0116064500 /NCGR_PEP_ID=MMETSP0322-20121206/9145_1 /TAXON_ID=163516 /ORGANISM="Leptocylindrus danicus var. apora, Strain B651" /LENGTH=141 /DNA_ID=CAMNT_0003550517 /DNA_START=167 /DNA_END=592 /DNA_ORIENTATION=-
MKLWTFTSILILLSTPVMCLASNLRILGSPIDSPMLTEEVASLESSMERSLRGTESKIVNQLDIMGFSEAQIDSVKRVPNQRKKGGVLKDMLDIRHDNIETYKNMSPQQRREYKLSMMRNHHANGASSKVSWHAGRMSESD